MAGTKRFAFKSDTLSKVRPDPARRFIVWDSTRPGFGLRVAPGGRRVYVLRYRHAGKQHLMNLGEFATFEEARAAYERERTRAKDARTARRNGEARPHPLEARQQRAGALVVVEREALTCAEAVAEYLAAQRQAGERRAAGKGNKAEPGLRQSTADLYDGIFTSDFLPHVKGRKLRDLTHNDILAILGKVAERKPSIAETLSNAIAALCTWALKRGLLDEHPARDLPTYYESPTRDRVLKSNELAALLKLLDGDAMRSGRMPKLALLLSLATGQRTGELVKLRWSAVDVAAKVLTIPRGTAKTDKALRVPLSPLALEVVGELYAQKQGRYIFPGDDPAKPLQQQSVRVMVTRNAALMRRHGIADFKPHDMRRTCRTMLTSRDVGAPTMIAEMILGHALPGKIEGRYDHNTYESDMYDALDKLSAHLCELRGKPAQPPSVIPLPVRAVSE